MHADSVRQSTERLYKIWWNCRKKTNGTFECYIMKWSHSSRVTLIVNMFTKVDKFKNWNDPQKQWLTKGKPPKQSKLRPQNYVQTRLEKVLGLPECTACSLPHVCWCRTRAVSFADPGMWMRRHVPKSENCGHQKYHQGPICHDTWILVSLAGWGHIKLWFSSLCFCFVFLFFPAKADALKLQKIPGSTNVWDLKGSLLSNNQKIFSWSL